MPRFIGTQMRRKGHDHLPPGRQRKLLIELGHVPVMADAIGVEAFRHFREQHRLFGRASRAGHAGLGVDDDLVELDRLGLDQRDQRQLRAGRVAAGIGDQPGLLDLAPVDFGQPIDGFFLQLGGVMLVAIPLRIGRRCRRAGSRPTGRRPWLPALA